MKSIKNLTVSIICYENNEQVYPGSLKCSFSDINNTIHYITDKGPVISDKNLNETSKYPQMGFVKCQIIETNSIYSVIDISNPWSLEDENGETIFKVSLDHIH